MSRSGRIVLFFGDREYAFRIGVGETEELDERFGLGLLEIQAAVLSLRVPVIGEVLRVGLVGGKDVARDKAAKLVGLFLRDGYFLECAEIAAKVVEAAAKGVPDDMPGEPAGEGTPSASPSPTAASGTPSSTPA